MDQKNKISDDDLMMISGGNDDDGESDGDACGDYCPPCSCGSTDVFRIGYEVSTRTPKYCCRTCHKIFT